MTMKRLYKVQRAETLLVGSVVSAAPGGVSRCERLEFEVFVVAVCYYDELLMISVLDDLSFAGPAARRAFNWPGFKSKYRSGTACEGWAMHREVVLVCLYVVQTLSASPIYPFYGSMIPLPYRGSVISGSDTLWERGDEVLDCMEKGDIDLVWRTSSRRLIGWKLEKRLDVSGLLVALMF